MKNKTANKKTKANKKEKNENPDISPCLYFQTCFEKTLKTKFLESTIQKEEQGKNNIQWSWDSLKTDLVKADYENAFHLINIYVINSYNDVINSEKVSSDSLLKVARVLVDKVEKLSDKTLDQILPLCNITCNSLIYISQSDINVTTHEQIIQMLFHILKQFYKKTHLQGALITVTAITNEYLLCKAKEFDVHQDIVKLVSTCQQIASSLYSKCLSAAVNKKTNDITDLFLVRSNELLLQLFLDYDNYLVIIIKFTYSWSILLSKGYKIDIARVTAKIRFIIFNVCKQTFKKNDEFNDAESIILKLIQLYILASLSTNSQKICFDLVAEYIYQVKSLHKLHNTIPLLKTLYPILLTLKLEDEECVTKSSLNEFTNIINLVDSNIKINKILLADILSMMKKYYIRNICVTLLANVLDIFSALFNHLCNMSNFADENVMEENVVQASLLIQRIGWIFQNILQMIQQVESTCKCSRNQLSQSFSKFAQIIESTFQTFFIGHFTPKLEEIKWLSSLIHNISVYYYTQEDYETSRIGFKLVVCLNNLLLESSDEQSFVHYLKEAVCKHDLLSNCMSKLGDMQGLHLTCINRVKLFQHHEVPEEDTEVQELFQTRVRCFVKLRIKLYYEDASKSKKSKSLFELIGGKNRCDKNSWFWLNLLSVEYDTMNKYSEKYDVNDALKEILEYQSAIYEAEGDLLNYSVIMIKMSTLHGQTYEERYHWCKETINVLEEMYSEVEGTSDQLEWHVKDLLACTYFQISIIQYEEKVATSKQWCDSELHTLIQEVYSENEKSDIRQENDNFNADTYLDQNYISSLNTALDYWMDVCNEANKIDDCSVFYNASHSAKYMYEAAIMYSLMCQNFSSVKCSYLSGIIYNMLSTTDANYSESAAISFMYSASQLLFVENKQSAEKILISLKNMTISCPIQQLQVELVNVAYLINNGKVDESKKILKDLLQSDLIKTQTKTSLTIKSEIFLLCSFLKLVPSNDEGDEVGLKPTDYHFPVESPFPPVVDCIRFLRTIYTSSIDPEYTGKINTDVNIHFSSSLNILDKLLLCLCHYASILKNQGSVLEARSILKESLLLARKFHLPFRVLEILQEVASIDLMLQNKKSFDENFTTMSTILKSVNDCFDDNNIYIPEFVNHVNDCSCICCAYPRLQQIHICLYLQYIESKKQHNDGVFENEISMQVIDALIENANMRYMNTQNETDEMIDKFSLTCSISEEIKPIQRKVKSSKSKRTKNIKEINKITNPISNDHSVNLFSRYHAAAKIIEPIKNQENNHMIKTVEQLITKIEQSSIMKNAQHEYHRLIAQLYCLRSLLYVGKDISSSWHLFPKHEEDSESNNYDKENTCEGDQEIEVETKGPTRSKRAKKTKDLPIETNNIKTTKKGRANLKSTKKTEISIETSTTKVVSRNKRNVKNESELPEESLIKKKSKSKTKSSKKIQDTLISELQPSKDINIDTFTNDLEKALSVLNPYTDTLIIKAIYQLITLISGLSNKQLTIACHFLLSARTLHQQLLSSYGKRLKTQYNTNQKVCNMEETNIQTTASIIQQYSEPKYVFTNNNIQELVDNHIPEGWRICSLSLIEMNEKNYLMISRLQNQVDSCIVRLNLNNTNDEVASGNVCNLASVFEENILEKFDDILQESKDSMTLKNMKDWLNERIRLDHQMKAFVSRIEENWLQGWFALLLGSPQCEDLTNIIECVANKIVDEFTSTCGGVTIEVELIKVLIEGYFSIKTKDLRRSIVYLVGEKLCKELEEIMSNEIENSKLESSLLMECERNPVVLILDKKLQKLPWESIPCLRNHPVTRMPSLLMTVTHCIKYKDMLKDQLKLQDTYYILNPRNDLKRTEDRFADWFKREDCWNGVIGRSPTTAEYIEALTKNDLFIYCGHGSGQEYLGWNAIQKLNCKAIALLMGCSSGKLIAEGEIEARGMSQHYLLAGSPAIVANLWDVTDKDIDIFLEDFLNRWLTKTKDLAVCVKEARNACKLTYLIGAAPVVYGLPIGLR